MKRLLLLPFLLLTVFAARAQFTLAGDAIDLGGGCFQLADTIPPASGPPDWLSAVWNNTTIDLNNGFDIRLFVSMTAELPDSYLAADGMAFVLQNTGTAAISTQPGGTLGYAHQSPGPPCPAVGPFAGGISPSLAVELDIYNNNGDCIIDGPDQDHIAIVQDGNFGAPLAGPIKAMASQNEISGGGPGNYRCREFRISYEAVTDTLRVWYNGVLLAKRRQDLIATVFGGNPIVYWGFTGATGGLAAHTIVCTEYADAGVGDSICTSATASLSASGGLSYSWSPAAGLSCTNCAAPTYTPGTVGPHGFQVTAVNFAGCRDVDSVYVEVLNTPIVDAGPAPSAICPGGSAPLNGSATGMDIFSWSPSGTLTGAGTLTPSASPLTTTNYTLSATDTVTGCSASDVVTVTVAAADSAYITTPDPSVLCMGDSIALTTVSTPGIDTYSWAPAAGLSSASSASPNASPASTTTYVLTASSSTTGCMSIDSVTIQVVDIQITPALTDVTLCGGVQFCAGPVTVTGETGSVSYDWSDGSSTLSTGDTLCQTPSGTTTYTLTVSDAGSGCSVTDAVTVTVAPGDSAIITLPDPTILCYGDSVVITTVSTPGIDTYVWSTTDSLSSGSVAQPTAFPATTTTYYLNASSTVSGCASLDSVTIQVVDLRFMNLPDTTICLGDSLCLGPLGVTGALGSIGYTWIAGGFIYSTADTLCTPLGATSNFVVTVVDSGSGCTVTDNFVVNVSSLQITAEPATASINPGQLIQVTVNGGVSWLWTGGIFNCDTCSTTIGTTNSEGTVTFTVTAQDTAGCPGVATITLLVEPYQVPNVFTPNGDGINDVVDLHYLGSDKQYEFSILDRWGNTLMVTHDPYKVWNGKTTGGTDAPEGVYFIAVRIIGDLAIPEGSKNGAFQVTLMR